MSPEYSVDAYTVKLKEHSVLGDGMLGVGHVCAVNLMFAAELPSTLRKWRDG